MLFWKRKRSSNKNQQNDEAKKTAKRDPNEISAQERAYLDQLEKLIGRPGRSPYVRRDKASRQSRQLPVTDPVYDSGPQPVGSETTGAENNKPPVSKPARPSLESEDGHVRLGPDGVYEIELDVPSADLEYLEERAPRRQPPAEPEEEKVEASRGATETVEAVTEEAQPQQPAGLYPPGTLVIWDDNRLAVYRESLPSKGYDVIYVVEPDGRLEPKGVCLHAYDHRRVGILSEGILHWMERTMRWERDALICHFDDPRDADAVAALKQPGKSDSQAAGSDQSVETFNGEPLVRGRTFTITVGKHQWHGVYWGRDKMGTIVAHNTNRTWSLMHLDLKRFGSSIKFGDVLPEEQIRQIEQAAANQH